MAAGPQDALTAARFSITIDGYEIASFSELQGITTSVEVVDFVESSDKEIIIKKLPGRKNPPTLVLKRGKNSGMELWGWHEAQFDVPIDNNAQERVFRSHVVG